MEHSDGETTARFQRETEGRPASHSSPRPAPHVGRKPSHLEADDWGEILCRHSVIPNFRKNGRITFTAGSYIDAIRAARELGVEDLMNNVALIRRSTLIPRLAERYSDILTARSTTGLREASPEYSAATGFPLWMHLLWCTAVVLIFAALVAAPYAAILNLWLLFLPYFTATMLLRACLLYNAARPEMVSATLPRHRPVVSILVPVFRESDSLPALIAHLDALDYPKRLLDIKILLEEDDIRTIQEARWLTAGTHICCLVVPPSAPRTKPKAMNFALPFARGEIVGIFDAEDAPEPDQIIKAVAALETAEPNVVCAQARLSHYNPEDNLLTRCVAMEYALWFDMLLTGLSRAKLPVPLGGTSLYFRTGILREIGGWDPDNVTEDADLGLRLARAGKRAVVFDSTTEEEATGSAMTWIGQRSRWIKGFMLTWAVHMRDPVRLTRELGFVPMVAINIMLLDGFLSFLIQPVMILSAIAALTMDTPPWLGLLEVPGIWIVLTILLAGQILLLCGAFVASYRRFGIRVAACVPLLWPYWMLGGFAALCAVVELAIRPQFWKKTAHCVSPVARARRAAILGHGE